jgi:hypothetical protein
MSIKLGFLASSHQQAAPLLLDTYPGAAAAYSLRKLRTAYTGAAIRVRRSVDSVESDIGFNGSGELDTTTLSTFIGSTNYGYVSVWYDQSGNGRNLTQTELAVQPIIIALGTIYQFGTKPSIYFPLSRLPGGGACTMDNTTFTLTQPNTYFIITQGTSANSTGDRNIFDGTGANRNAIGKSNVNPNYFMYAGSLVYSTTLVDNIKNLFVPIFNNTSSFLYKNGNSILSNANPGTQSLEGLRLAGFQKQQANWENYMPEFIVYNTNQASNRTGIESNINTYYTIF